MTITIDELQVVWAALLVTIGVLLFAVRLLLWCIRSLYESPRLKVDIDITTYGLKYAVFRLERRVWKHRAGGYDNKWDAVHAMNLMKELPVYDK